MNRTSIKILCFFLITFQFILPIVILKASYFIDQSSPLFELNNLELNSTQVTTNHGYDYEPTVFKDNSNHLWVIWCNGTGSDGEIWASTSEKPYNSWGTPFKITDDPFDDWDPTGLIDSNGVLWIFWHSNRFNSYDIWYKNSSDNGLSWSQAYQLTNNSSNENRANAFVDDTNTIWVFYTTTTRGSTDIAFQKSENQGISWQPEEIIPISDISTHEQINDAFISQNGDFILFVQQLQSSWGSFVWISDDSGNNWEKYQITPFENNGWGTIFTTNHDETLYVIYERDLVFYLRSTDRQNVDWSDEEILTSTAYGNQHPNCFVDSNDTIYVVWSSNQVGDQEIYLKLIEADDPDSPFTGIFPLELLSGLGSILLVGIIASISLLVSVFLYRGYSARKKSDAEYVPVDYTLDEMIKATLSLIIGHILYPPKIRKLSISEIESNNTRAIILQLLEENDFLHFREIMRRIPTGTALLRWHLQVLEDFNFIRHIRHGQYSIYYLRDKPPNKHYIALHFALTTKFAVNLVSLFVKVDIWTISGLVERLNKPRKKILYHCKRLIQHEILQKDQQDFLSLNPVYKEWITLILLKKSNIT